MAGMGTLVVLDDFYTSSRSTDLLSKTTIDTDDAVHIIDPQTNQTFCEQDANERVAVKLSEKWPNEIDGCWTCIMKAANRKG
jgi:hypothetical protein